jgi:hypothetical protein
MRIFRHVFKKFRRLTQARQSGRSPSRHCRAWRA